MENVDEICLLESAMLSFGKCRENLSSFFLTIYIFPSALSLGSFSTGDCAFLSPEKYSVVPLQVLSSASFFLSCFLL